MSHLRDKLLLICSPWLNITRMLSLHRVLRCRGLAWACVWYSSMRHIVCEIVWTTHPQSRDVEKYDHIRAICVVGGLAIGIIPAGSSLANTVEDRILYSVCTSENNVVV